MYGLKTIHRTLKPANVQKIQNISVSWCKTSKNASTSVSEVQHKDRLNENLPLLENNYRGESSENYLFDQELDVLKKQHLEDFVKIVDKFQKASLVDLQKIIFSAQRLQASHQNPLLTDTEHRAQLTEQLQTLNKLNFQRKEKTNSKVFRKHDSAETNPTDNLVKTKPHPVTGVPLKTSPSETAGKKNSKRQRKEQASKLTSGLPVSDSEGKECFDELSNILKMDKETLMELATGEDKHKREATFLADVSSYVDLCIKTDQLHEAQAFVTSCYMVLRKKSLSHNYKRRTSHRPIRDVNIYAQLMRAWAKKGNIEAIVKLYAQLQDMNVRPNMAVYAACFECFGRQPDSVDVDLMKDFLKDIETHGLKLEDVFIGSAYTSQDKELIIKVISTVVPDFVPRSEERSHLYSCRLLNSLNEKPDTVNPFVNVLKSDIFPKLRQTLDCEIQDHVVIKSIKTQSNSLSPATKEARANLEKYKTEWRKALKSQYLSEKKFMEINHKFCGGVSLRPFLNLWGVDTFVDLMMQEVEMIGRDMSNYSPALSHLYLSLGSRIHGKFLVQCRAKSENFKKFVPVYMDYLRGFNEEIVPGNHRVMWNEVAASKLYEPVENIDWSMARRKELGEFLYKIILNEVKIKAPDQNSKTPTVSSGTSAIILDYDVIDDVKTEVIKPHNFLAKLYKDAMINELTFSPKELPLLLPPVPWTTPTQGGHILNSVELIRNTFASKEQADLIRSLPTEQLYPIFDGLNTISACPWMVNETVLDLAIDIFNKGGNSKLDIPESMDNIDDKLIEITEKMSNERKRSAQWKNKKIKKELYSLWCTELYRLSIANKYRKDVFWLPHNIDFRGRSYPTAPHLNHLGGDLSRSILLFGVGRPLGKDGLDWLKIHLVNLTGFMKRKSNRDRLAYANQMMHEIQDSADRPLEGRKWWQKSDKPWQTLACCMEITRAVRSPDPEQYINHLPIHQDGSCNGLQHYAALGRDEDGARSVSLMPSDVPQDVYSDVVELIENDRKSDASLLPTAAALEGFVSRKVVKQSIMTSVYGVTRYGAREQIAGQLKDIKEFPRELIFQAKDYLAVKTSRNLKKLFHSSEEIQNWFSLCARIIASIKVKRVSWVTPLGLPIIQPYSQDVRLKVDSEFKESLGSSVGYGKPMLHKQRNAFPPNFIHSLDSTHMFLTAIHCFRSGILFASVHDCFWTHACHVPEMNKICREQFVALHKEPILEDLSQHFLEHFGYPDDENGSDKNVMNKNLAKQKINEIFKKVPGKGKFNIDEVLNSTYFFS